jgi:Fe2+ transport system protein FeoA
MSRSLADLPRGGQGTLAALDLPPDEVDRLMAMGFIPGVRITMTRSAPGGDPVVFHVDGAEVALRRSTARHLLIEETA